jgi:hypothetical protein
MRRIYMSKTESSQPSQSSLKERIKGHVESFKSKVVESGNKLRAMAKYDKSRRGTAADEKTEVSKEISVQEKVGMLRDIFSKNEDIKQLASLLDDKEAAQVYLTINHPDLIKGLSSGDLLFLERYLRGEAQKKLSEIATKESTKIGAIAEMAMIKKWGVAKIANREAWTNPADDPNVLVTKLFEEKGFGKQSSRFANWSLSEVPIDKYEKSVYRSPNFSADAKYIAEGFVIDAEGRLSNIFTNELVEKYAKGGEIAIINWRANRAQETDKLISELKQAGVEQKIADNLVNKEIIPKVTAQVMAYMDKQF